MILALEVCRFGKAIGAGARPGRRPSFPDKAWATWCPLLARGPPAPAPKHPRRATPALPHSPSPPISQLRAWETSCTPLCAAPKHTQLSRSPESPLSLPCVRGCVCVWGCVLSCSGGPQAITVQPLRIFSVLAVGQGWWACVVSGHPRALGSWAPRHTALLLSGLPFRSSAEEFLELASGAWGFGPQELSNKPWGSSLPQSRLPVL